MSLLPPVWLITGCSSGFGASLALCALRAGHKVIATSRTPSKTPNLVSEVEKLGGTWRTLDVCSPDVPSIIEEAVKVYGRIDYLVNNAGYALLGAFEDMRYGVLGIYYFIPIPINFHFHPINIHTKSYIIIDL
jgi:NAD(P)-dependent dehydrogenase (short-subunit alcohol dehydrogenase family)